MDKCDVALLNKRETALYLNISPRTLDLWLKQRRIPFIKMGDSKSSLVRFNRADLETMIERLTIKSR